MTKDLDERFAAAMVAVFDKVPEPLCLAVSGGSDSMALMALIASWQQQHSPATKVSVITVDHRLRPESAGEADFVKSRAKSYGFDHHTLVWTGWDGTGNTQNEARQARYYLINAHLGENATILTGHTLDDQAETVLMRIKRGSGVDGLAAMQPRMTQHNGLTVVRPLLAFRRQELRTYLRAHAIDWVDDPSNENTQYDRVAIRALLPELEKAGISAEKFALMAHHMSHAQKVLQHAAQVAFDAIGEQTPIGLAFRETDFLTLERDIQTRLISAAIMWTSNVPFRPRYDTLTKCLGQVQTGHAQTLMGALMFRRRGKIYVVREYARCAETVAMLMGTVWDNIWCIQNDTSEAQVGCLGEKGVAQLDPACKKLFPSRALWAQPAIFQNDKLLAAPSLIKKDAAYLRDLRPKFREFLKGH